MQSLRRGFGFIGRVFLLLWMATGVATAAPPLAHDDTTAPLTFGILPIGGPSESLQAWRPMLDDMSQRLGRPIRSISVSTYEGISQAISEQRVDIAFLSGRLALDAVTRQNMQVVAQLTRGDLSKGYYAVLLVAADSPLHSVDELLKKPGKYRYARGEALSVSGYLVPETQLFAARGLDSDTYFASVHIDNHQNNALAVANGEADVATNNTADMERFRQHFPDQAARLRELWRSPMIPHAVLVVRTDLPASLRTQIATFLTQYAKGRDADREEANLKLIHDISGFAPAGNDTLTPFADIEYNLERRRALTARWVNDAARDARLAKIEQDRKQLLRQLSGKTP
jgi:phosphonate transport system substrate-binding protein